MVSDVELVPGVPGIMDEYVEAPKTLGSRGDQVIAERFIEQISWDGEETSTFGFHE